MNKMSKLRRFKTEEEFADFIDAHDTAEYWGQFQDVPGVQISVSRPLEGAEPLELYPDLLEAIKGVAQRKGVPYQALVRQWLREKLKEELPHA